MRRWAPAAALLCAVVGAGPVVAQRTADADLAQVKSWLAGEWNNNEQVWQQGIDAQEAKAGSQPVVRSPHLHALVAPVAAPRVGAHVLYSTQSPGTDPAKPFVKRLLVLGTEPGNAVRIDVFKFRDDAPFAEGARKPEPFAALDPAQLERLAGCELVLRFDPAQQGWAGAVDKTRCASADTLLLAESTATVGAADIAPVIKLRKARYFEGWVWIKNAGPTAAADDKRASFTRKLQLHSEGQRIPVMFEDGSTSPYLLELALLTYQNTRRPILKLALVDAASGKSVAYTWANPDASMIGMNLGWFQAGMTQKAERVNFGF